MMEKRALYFEAGAAEVWVCNEAGELQFFDANGQLDRSILVPGFPLKIEV